MIEVLGVCGTKLNLKLQKMLLIAIEPLVLSCQTWEQASLTKFVKIYISLNDQRPEGERGLADLEFYRQWLDALEVIIYVPYTSVDRGNDRDSLNELQRTIWKFCELVMAPEGSTLVRMAWILFTCNVLDKTNSKGGEEGGAELPTLTAFCFQLLDHLPIWLANKARKKLIDEAYNSMKSILEAIGKWTRAKYNSPSGKMGQAWTAAYKVLIEIIDLMEFSKFTEWETLGAVIEGTLDTIHTIPENIDAQQLEEDELVDISFIKTLQASIVPNISNEKVAQSIFTKLEKCSRFVNVWAPLPPETLQRSLWEADPVPKAALANACLQMLFDCGCGAVPANPAVRQAALNSLLRRCRKVLLNYARIGKYYWQVFPQIVVEEVYHTLDKLSNSRLLRGENVGGSGGGTTDHLWTLSDLLLEFVYYTSRFSDRPVAMTNPNTQQQLQTECGNDLRMAVSLKAKSILNALLAEVREQKGIRVFLDKKTDITEIDYDSTDPDAYF